MNLLEYICWVTGRIRSKLQINKQYLIFIALIGIWIFSRIINLTWHVYDWMYICMFKLNINLQEVISSWKAGQNIHNKIEK